MIGDEDDDDADDDDDDADAADDDDDDDDENERCTSTKCLRKSMFQHVWIFLVAYLNNKKQFGVCNAQTQQGRFFLVGEKKPRFPQGFTSTSLASQFEPFAAGGTGRTATCCSGTKSIRGATCVLFEEILLGKQLCFFFSGFLFCRVVVCFFF